MKRFATAAFLIAGLLLVPSAHAQLGIAAGLNFESLSDVSSSGSESLDNSTGYHFGVFYDIGAGPLDLRLAAIYRQLGDFTPNGLTSSDLKASAIDFPIDVRFSLLPTPIIKPYFLLGPVFSMPRSSDDEFDGALNSLAVAGNAGIGIKINAGGVTLTPELRYSFGISSFMSDGFSVGGQTIAAADRSNAAMVRVGIGF